MSCYATVGNTQHSVLSTGNSSEVHAMIWCLPLGVGVGGCVKNSGIAMLLNTNCCCYYSWGKRTPNICILNFFPDFDTPTVDWRMFMKCILLLILTTRGAHVLLKAVPEHWKTHPGFELPAASTFCPSTPFDCRSNVASKWLIFI